MVAAIHLIYVANKPMTTRPLASQPTIVDDNWIDSRITLGYQPVKMADDPASVSSRNSHAERAQVIRGIHFLRMVPGGISSPIAVAVLCALVVAVLVSVLAEVLRRSGAVMSDIETNVAIAVVLGAFAGIHDYFYTRRGNEANRWDLVVDHNQGLLQIPAITAYSQPIMLELADVVRLQLKTLIDANRSENEQGIYRLYIVCREPSCRATCKAAASEGDAAGQTSRHPTIEDPLIKHTIKQSRYRSDLLGFANWLQDILELESPIEGKSSTSGTIERLAEIRKTSLPC